MGMIKNVFYNLDKEINIKKIKYKEKRLLKMIQFSFKKFLKKV